MLYAKINNSKVEKYPYSFMDLRLENKNVSFSDNMSEEELNGWGVYSVELVDPPVEDFDSKVSEGEPQFIDGSWKQNWVITKLTKKELSQKTEDKSSSFRKRRDALLKDSDWTQGKDIPENISTAWAEYRQKLRDLPSQKGFPSKISWPKEPK